MFSVLGTCESIGQDATGFTIERLGIDQGMIDQRVQVSWSTGPRTALLERSSDLSSGVPWEVVPIVPVLQAGRFLVDIQTRTPSEFYRLGTGTIIFVDSENERAGSGTFFDPFQSLKSGLAEARIRFGQSGDQQLLYVFSKNYPEVIDISSPPGFKVSIISSRVPLTLGAQVFGGDSRARLVGPEGQTAVNVSNCASFRLVGFEITAENATGFRAESVGALAVADCTVDSSAGHSMECESPASRAGMSISIMYRVRTQQNQG